MSNASRPSTSEGLAQHQAVLDAQAAELAAHQQATDAQSAQARAIVAGVALAQYVGPDDPAGGHPAADLPPAGDGS